MLELPVLNNFQIQETKPSNGNGQHQTYKVGVRRKTRIVNVGGILVGGTYPISVQTMTKTKTSDVDATVKQICDAADAGCDIVRVTVNDKEADRKSTRLNSSHRT